jgi:hypothetical protein
MGSIPNTTNFSLQDVKNVVHQNDLASCLIYAVDAYFDPAYKGSKNNLLNFRNYQEPYISCSPTSCRYHNNKVPYDSPSTTVSYAQGTYTYSWTTGSHFTYSKSGNTFTITCNGNNSSGVAWSDTLTFRLGSTLTATFSVVQFTSPA